MDEDDEDEGYSGANHNGALSLLQPSSILRDTQGESFQETPYGRSNTSGRDSFGSNFQSSFGQREGKDIPDAVVTTIAKDAASRLGPARVTEPADLILDTEAIVNRLYTLDDGSDLGTGLNDDIATASKELTELWRSLEEDTSMSGDVDGDIFVVGPAEGSSNVSKAAFLGDALLRLHGRPFAQDLRSNGLRSIMSSQNAASAAFSQSLPYPKVLLNWLNEVHDPYPEALSDLKLQQPNAASHPNFWEILHTILLRGEIQSVITILKQADFKHARTSIEDGQGRVGYSGTLLANTRTQIERAVQLLERCPAVNRNDWNIRGGDWSIFRRAVLQTSNDLTAFAEPMLRSREDDALSFKKSDKNSISQAARKAESKVPWAVYQQLRALYNILLGKTTELIAFSQDWVEATTFLTAWWAGEDHTRPLNINSEEDEEQSAYVRRLIRSFARVTDSSRNDSFQVRSDRLVEVGLACIFQGSINESIGVMRTYSLAVTSAVAEIGTVAGWFTSAGGAPDGLDQSDLMVLSSYEGSKTLFTRDSLLLDYGKGLFDRDVLEGSAGAREGWEIGLQVFGRVEDYELIAGKIGEYLERLNLSSGDRVDRLLQICNNIGLSDHARKVAEVSALMRSLFHTLTSSQKYADSLADSSFNYGEALIYYARSHSIKKVKNILDLLISFCLVQSTAFPSNSDLDPDLRDLITNPTSTLKKMAMVDADAAEIVHTHLSGYATLRRFYDLRDQSLTSDLPLHRIKAQAAVALLTVIASSADNIHGGLYDAKRGSIVAVDGLLALLGEALPFLNNTPRTLKMTQVFALLKAIEDVQTVTPRVYAQCNEFLQSTLEAAHASGSGNGSPRHLLKKSMSEMTASSVDGWSLTGSEFLRDSLVNSGVLVRAERKRGWDWRTGLRRGANGEDVLRILRLGLAQELAAGWIQDE